MLKKFTQYIRESILALICKNLATSLCLATFRPSGFKVFLAIYLAESIRNNVVEDILRGGHPDLSYLQSRNMSWLVEHIPCEVRSKVHRTLLALMKVNIY